MRKVQTWLVVRSGKKQMIKDTIEFFTSLLICFLDIYIDNLYVSCWPMACNEYKLVDWLYRSCCRPTRQRNEPQANDGLERIGCINCIFSLFSNITIGEFINNLSLINAFVKLFHKMWNHQRNQNNNERDHVVGRQKTKDWQIPSNSFDSFAVFEGIVQSRRLAAADWLGRIGGDGRKTNPTFNDKAAQANVL